MRVAVSANLRQPPVVTETPAMAPPPLRSRANTPFGARIGMDIASFQRLFPALPVTTPDSQVGVDAVVHGLDGRWTYTFKGGKLSWSLFDKYIDEITASNFDLCLAAIDAIIADYTRQYGPPARLETGTRIFKDPHKEHHWGYDVMRATWKAEGMKFQANFNFMGGKGVYHFLVKMEFQREDYAYF